MNILFPGQIERFVFIREKVIRKGKYRNHCAGNGSRISEGNNDIQTVMSPWTVRIEILSGEIRRGRSPASPDSLRHNNPHSL